MIDHETLAARDYRFDDAPPKDPGEGMDVVLDCTPWCINRWLAGEDYPVTTSYVLPSNPTGFAYQATTGGRSAAREPRWPMTLGQTVNDGSVVWTAVAPATNGLNAISSPSAVSEPTGLTISGVAVSESRKITATYAGGTHGYDYAAVFTFTLRGITRIARQLVPVRRR